MLLKFPILEKLILLNNSPNNIDIKCLIKSINVQTIKILKVIKMEYKNKYGEFIYDDTLNNSFHI